MPAAGSASRVSAAPPATSSRSIGSGSTGCGPETPAAGVPRAGAPGAGRDGGAVVPAGGRLGAAATGCVTGPVSAGALTPATGTDVAGGTAASGGAALFAGAPFLAAVFLGISCVVRAESDAAAAAFLPAVPAMRTASAAAL